MKAFNQFLQIVHQRGISILLAVIIILGCTSCATEPLSMNPDLFKKKSDPEGQCSLSIVQTSASFPSETSHDATIRVDGTMNQYCDNLQVAYEKPDVGKNIRIEIVAASTQAAGNSERPFVVEVVAKSLRYGSYTVWVNGVAETIFSVN